MTTIKFSFFKKFFEAPSASGRSEEYVHSTPGGFHGRPPPLGPAGRSDGSRRGADGPDVHHRTPMNAEFSEMTGDSPPAQPKFPLTPRDRSQSNRINICDGFSRMLIVEFLLVRRKAEAQDDTVRVESVDVILAGLRELNRGLWSDDMTSGKSPEFTFLIFDIFCRLTGRPCDPILLKKAGSHYLLEWGIPVAALSHFNLAWRFNPHDEALPMLIATALQAIKSQKEHRERAARQG